MRYIDSPSTDAYFNMALEEYVFESLPQTDAYFMLWQNKNAIVVGKYQNTIEEINLEYVKEQGITVVRRLSGGGAMYQDLGNLNFTFVVNQEAEKSLDFEIFMRPVIRSLAQMGVQAECNSRNDIVIEGKKFSGNAQYNKKGRTMHHGTLLFNSNLAVVGDALRVKAAKIESKGIKSLRSRVTNIAEHLPSPMTLAEFKVRLVANIFSVDESISTYTLTPQDYAGIKELQDNKYATWEWNYGKSPPYNLHKERRYDFGSVALYMSVEKGMIVHAELTGDFFGNGDIDVVTDALVEVPLQEKEIATALSTVAVGEHIKGMDLQTFVNLVLI